MRGPDDKDAAAIGLQPRLAMCLLVVSIGLFATRVSAQNVSPLHGTLSTDNAAFPDALNNSNTTAGAGAPLLLDDAQDDDDSRTAALPGDNILAPRGDIWPAPPPVEYAICPEATDVPPGCPPLTNEWEWTRFSDYKNGFFQKLAASSAWLAGSRSSDDIGLIESQLYFTFALPVPTRNWPMLVTPSFETRWLDGPLSSGAAPADAPAQLYSAFVEMMWVPQITKRWTAVLGATPGIYSDFQHNYGDQFRLMGRALGRYEITKNRNYFVAGVVYLPRSDYRLIPAGGLMWSPWDDVQLDLIFPIPRLAYRLSYNQTIERWVYTAAEFGGGTWSIERADGSRDNLTLRDLRLLLGYERKRDGGGGLRFEVGYIFSRRLEYDSTTPDVILPDTLMLRSRMAF